MTIIITISTVFFYYYYYFVVVVVAVTVTVIELFSNQTMYLFSCVIKSISETNLYIKYVVLFVL